MHHSKQCDRAGQEITLREQAGMGSPTGTDEVRLGIVEMDAVNLASQASTLVTAYFLFGQTAGS
jgi:hypothetical protein